MMASASSSCLGARRWNSNLVGKSQASCCRAAESTGALVESAGSDSDTSSVADKHDGAFASRDYSLSTMLRKDTMPRADRLQRDLFFRLCTPKRVLG
jgi:hypothetical protein